MLVSLLLQGEGHPALLPWIEELRCVGGVVASQEQDVLAEDSGRVSHPALQVGQEWGPA